MFFSATVPRMNELIRCYQIFEWESGLIWDSFADWTWLRFPSLFRFQLPWQAESTMCLHHSSCRCHFFNFTCLLFFTFFSYSSVILCLKSLFGSHFDLECSSHQESQTQSQTAALTIGLLQLSLYPVRYYLNGVITHPIAYDNLWQFKRVMARWFGPWGK